MNEFILIHPIYPIYVVSQKSHYCMLNVFFYIVTLNKKCHCSLVMYDTFLKLFSLLKPDWLQAHIKRICLHLINNYG